VPVYAQLCGRLELKEGCTYGLYLYCFRKSGFSAVKTVPLGQMAGQRILWHLHGLVPQAVEKALNLMMSN
jgi:urease accessory protein